MAIRDLKDRLAGQVMFIFCLLILALAFFIIFGIYKRAEPIFAHNSFASLFFSSEWRPTEGKFGLLGFISGTLWVTLIAVIIAVPMSLLAAIYLTEYAHKNVRAVLRPPIDLLSGISPVIFGVWGIIVVVPFVRDMVIPFADNYLKFRPFLTENYTGFSALSAGIVLSVMVFPIIVSVAIEVLDSVPREVRNASLSLGATNWQTIKHAVLKKAAPGIVASVILGFSRAFGETMAVLMVAGCSLQQVPHSPFDAAYPLPAFIANTYGEMMSIPLYDSAVFLAAFILLILTALFNIAGWAILVRAGKKEAYFG